MPVVSVSVPSTILEEVETIRENEGYASRSELVRTALRDYVNNYKVKKQLEGTLNGFLSITYPMGDKTCSDKIKKLHHAHDQVVRGSLHLHFKEETCFDVWVIEGKAKQILSLIEQLKAIRGTKHVGKDLISV